MTSTDDLDDRSGAWLTWPVVEAVLRLKLRQASRWRVFLAVLLVSARYGGRPARLGIDDLALLTGLAPRTVKGALSALRHGGLVLRARRARLLSVPLLSTKLPSRTKRSIFTRRQEIVIAATLAEATKLVGSDAGALVMPVHCASQLGLRSPITYAQAYMRLKRSGSRAAAAIYVGAVLALRRDERVQGRGLC
jgi:hypothetical protein